MEQLEKRIKELRIKIEHTKDELYRAELRLESLEKDEQDVLEECSNLGLEPEKLDEEIEKLENQIKQDLEQVTSILAKENLKE
ncbi:MAG: hypothetical protein RLZ12_28 [Bacillota bacterium]|jgi:chromosome segregation ATPase